MKKYFYLFTTFLLSILSSNAQAANAKIHSVYNHLAILELSDGNVCCAFIDDLTWDERFDMIDNIQVHPDMVPVVDTGDIEFTLEANGPEGVLHYAGHSLNVEVLNPEEVAIIPANFMGEDEPEEEESRAESLSNYWENLATTTPNLRYLHFEGGLKEDSFLKVLDLFPNLESLSVEDCLEVSNDSFRLINEKLPHLYSLIFSYSSVDMSVIEEVIASSNQISYADIDGRFSFENPCDHNALCNRSWTYLKVYNNVSIETARQLAASSPHLLNADFDVDTSHRPRLRLALRNYYHSLGTSCPELHTLAVVWPDTLCLDLIGSACMNCKDLVTLNITAPDIDLQCAEYIGRSFPKLRNIKLKCKNLSAKALDKLLEYGHSIEEFEIEESNFGMEHCEVIQKYPQVRHLELDECSSFDTAACIYVLENCPQLRDFSFEECAVKDDELLQWDGVNESLYFFTGFAGLDDSEENSDEDSESRNRHYKLCTVWMEARFPNLKLRFPRIESVSEEASEIEAEAGDEVAEDTEESTEEAEETEADDVDNEEISEVEEDTDIDDLEESEVADDEVEEIEINDVDDEEISEVEEDTNIDDLEDSEVADDEVEEIEINDVDDEEISEVEEEVA